MVSLQFDADIGKLRQRTQKKNVIKIFYSIDIAIQQNIMKFIIMHVIALCDRFFFCCHTAIIFTGTFASSCYPRAFFSTIYSTHSLTSINFMTHNCFYDYVDDDDTDAIDTFGICKIFYSFPQLSSTLSFFFYSHFSLCLTNYRQEVEMMLMMMKKN